MGLKEMQKKISPIFLEYGVKKASFFGSASRGEMNKNSDVDIVVELGGSMGLVSYIKMENDLQKKLGKKVDLLTSKGMNKRLKKYIVSDLKTIYERR